ncbi:PhzF family phenazine biosynthesis protein [Paenibacillus sp. 481]|uniref:PhzF family phenazine biosynthesis protein n=1 Tax=Paenibacillus sp. 481 TaxID=2835869 RepID=UPI0022B2EBC2|nr:PhzF family phenazine biosynthesis protein [Paenibacillus sp. 481]
MSSVDAHAWSGHEGREGDEHMSHPYSVRIFTPTEEVPFAGHPTIGTAYIIREQLLQQGIRSVDALTLSLQVGQIEVEFTQAPSLVVWMEQGEPTFGSTFAPQELADVLRIDVSLIDERFPIQEVSTGLAALIVPIKSLAAIKACNVNLEKYNKLIARTEAKQLHLFCPEPYEQGHQLNTRNFGPYYGSDEDAATGSANGALAAYLVQHQYFGSDESETEEIDIEVEQGYEMGRPSVIALRAAKSEGRMSVHIGGKVVPVGKGELYLD